MMMEMSSAYALVSVMGNSVMGGYPTLKMEEVGPSLRWWSMISIKRLNKSGDNVHPCLTPLVMFIYVLLFV